MSKYNLSFHSWKYQYEHQYDIYNCKYCKTFAWTRLVAYKICDTLTKCFLFIFFYYYSFILRIKTFFWSLYFSLLVHLFLLFLLFLYCFYIIYLTEYIIIIIYSIDYIRNLISFFNWFFHYIITIFIYILYIDIDI